MTVFEAMMVTLTFAIFLVGLITLIILIVKSMKK
ncbi:MAG: putative holin-like toxin [Defluviitaleaceae bacterium]|nr:putative holin-like toxin [Defluviitaleaceae bacterium]